MSTIYKFLVGIVVLFGVCICPLESSEVSHEEKDGNNGHASYEHDELQNSMLDTNQTNQIGSQVGTQIGSNLLFGLGGPTITGVVSWMGLPFIG